MSSRCCRSSRLRDGPLTSRPEVFQLRELNDNPDVQATAGRLLAMVTGITPSLDLIEPLMAALISILQDSTVRLLLGDD